MMVKHAIVFLVATLLAVGAYDWWLYLTEGPSATISAEVLSTSRKWPVVPLLVGILMGHLFWPQALPSK